MNVNKQKGHGPDNMGKMENPDGFACVKGLCNDTMEMYLSIDSEKITDAKFNTDGCKSSIACGSAAANLAVGKTFNEVLRLSPADIIDEWAIFPQENIHCAILAVNTLHNAFTDYLLRRAQTGS
jgi:nitrogen fixation NifU-like protein